MDKYKLKILTTAQRQLEEIYDIHFELAGASSAMKITNAIYSALEHLESGVVCKNELLKEGYRMLICGRYLCFYRVIGKMVYVYHIVHGATDYPKLFRDLEIKSRAVL